MKTEYKIALMAVVLGVVCSFVMQAIVLNATIDWIEQYDRIDIRLFI